MGICLDPGTQGVGLGRNVYVGVSNPSQALPALYPQKGNSRCNGQWGGGVDPGEKGAILEAGGPGPPGGGKGWQSASDSRGEET
jgi:hypothetical protein